MSPRPQKLGKGAISTQDGRSKAEIKAELQLPQVHFQSCGKFGKTIEKLLAFQIRASHAGFFCRSHAQQMGHLLKCA